MIELMTLNIFSILIFKGAPKHPLLKLTNITFSEYRGMVPFYLNSSV